MSDDTTAVKKRAPRRRKAKPAAQPVVETIDTRTPKSSKAAAPAPSAVKAPAPKRQQAARKSKRAATPSPEATSALLPESAATATASEKPKLESASEPAAPAHRILMRVPLAVRWRDLDAFNHVNNSKYLSYLEEARLQWMLTLPGQGLDERVAPVVAAAQLNYRRPIEWPAQVMVELFVERLGNTSVTVGHRILGEREGAAPILFCDGNVVLVWIDRSSGSAAALPTPVRESCT